ncbi:RibD family protein [Merismopedia glauca]|nr:dihydrofolate reductase family protein [Merismopedia glauca]
MEHPSDTRTNLSSLQTTVILAMTADGKIADVKRLHPLFGSQHDRSHLERQVAIADGVIFGAGTLRAGGTAMRVIDPQLIQQRQDAGKPPQPVQILCTRTGKIDSNLPFFRQPVPRWLVTSPKGAENWQGKSEFDKIIVFEADDGEIDWLKTFAEFQKLGLNNLAVLGGGELIASLIAVDLIDEFWLTLCPLVLGGLEAPTPVAGEGFILNSAPKLNLLSVERIEDELFLHYRVKR